MIRGRNRPFRKLRRQRIEKFSARFCRKLSTILFTKEKSMNWRFRRNFFFFSVDAFSSEKFFKCKGMRPRLMLSVFSPPEKLYRMLTQKLFFSEIYFSLSYLFTYLFLFKTSKRHWERRFFFSELETLKVSTIWQSMKKSNFDF